jgi:hypothetical protein
MGLQHDFPKAVGYDVIDEESDTLKYPKLLKI